MGDWTVELDDGSIEGAEGRVNLSPKLLGLFERLAASALSWAGEDEPALATLQQLRRLPPPAGNDGRVGLVEAWLWEANLERPLEAANRAAEKAQTQGAGLLFTVAKLEEPMGDAPGGGLALVARKAAALLEHAAGARGEERGRGSLAVVSGPEQGRWVLSGCWKRGAFRRLAREEDGAGQ